MNALYADADGNVVDPLGGLPDLLARRVRFVGDACTRIAEDYLRILRFFRFHAHFGNPDEGLDAEGLAACAAGSAGIETLSAERIGAEMKKLLAAPDPAPSVCAMAQAGILLQVLPGGDPQFLAPLVHVESGHPPRWQRRLAVLGGDLIRLRLSKAETVTVSAIRDEIGSLRSPAALAFLHGAEVAADVLLIRAARSLEHTLLQIGNAFLLQLVEGGNEHDAVEHPTPKSAMKPTPALMLKGMPRAMSASTPPMALMGMARVDQQGALHAVEGEEEQQEDEGQRDGHRQHQAFASCLQVLEGAAEGVVVGRGHWHFGIDAALELFHEAFHVTATDVHAHGDAALGILPADLGRGGCQGHIGHLLQLDLSATGQRHEEGAHIVDALPLLVTEAHHQIVDKDYFTGGIEITKCLVGGKNIYINNDSLLQYGDATNLWLDLPKPLPTADSVVLVFDWQYKIATDMDSHREGVIDSASFFIAYFFPRIAVYDDVFGWNNTQYNDQVEFYNDFCNFDYTITVPQYYQVWATGDWLNANEILDKQTLKKYNAAMSSTSEVNIFDSLYYFQKSKDNTQTTWGWISNDQEEFCMSALFH